MAHTPTTWTVTIKRDGERASKVSFSARESISEDGDGYHYGYATDEALGIALCEAIRATAQHDEDPWLLATVANMLLYLSIWHGTPELRDIADAAKQVFADLNPDTRGELQ